MIEGGPTESVTPSEVVDAQPAPTPVEVGIASGLQFRIDERYEVDGDAEVIVKSDVLGSTLLRGSILDISATGCYIKTIARAPIKPGTEVNIIFSIYGTTFRVEAMSRFAKTQVGIGFRFLEMDSATRVRLHGVLADIRSKLIKNDPKGVVPVVERTKLD
jgi:hypothetical protein